MTRTHSEEDRKDGAPAKGPGSLSRVVETHRDLKQRRR